MTQLDRSQRSVMPNSEVFTPEDYKEALHMESYLESVANTMGLPVDPRDEDLEARGETAIAELNIPQTDAILEKTQRLLTTIETACEQVSGVVVSPNKHEAESFISNKAREVYNQKPFNDQLRYIAARYIVEYLERYTENTGNPASESTWAEALAHAEALTQNIPELASSVYENDIPAYSILYREFDQMRQAGDFPMEVYLGRDGIYAYYGRLAQNAARGDNDPVTGQFPLEKAQLVLRPDPKYIVYSRGVMHGADPSKKERYIRQFIDSEDELHFYDTGYVGSIPQDIMTILGFSTDEINKRIHLLNTQINERRLKGLPDNVDIEIIENHPKDEDSAFGLTESEDGIKYETSPVMLEEQFRFLVVRDILLRHFWIREYMEISEHLGEQVLGANPEYVG